MLKDPFEKLPSQTEVEPVDYSDTEKIERFVMLYEIGFLDFLNEKLPSSVSETTKDALDGE